MQILRDGVDATTEEQVRITEIPAPPFHETVRAAYLKKLFAATGLRVETDDTGNVIGEWAGTSPDIVMLTAHLDTVFPPSTDVRVKQEGGCRVVVCPLPRKSPWLHRIEPKWVHGKRAIAEPDRKLPVDELKHRICAYYDCELLESIAQKVA